MVKHIVMWNFNEQTRANNPEAVFTSLREQFRELVGKVDGLVEIELGRGYKADSRDLALYCAFTCREAEAAYQTNPLHLAVATQVREHTCDRAVIDYEV